MKIFISSLISGFGEFREAAKTAVTTLRHEPVMAENFGARPASPQLTCLQGVRSADLVLLILGERYGSVQGDSGVSPTHEEFLEAKDRKDVLVFVQQGVTPELTQSAFLQEVQAWQGGFFRIGFTTPEELKAAVIQSLHDYELAHATSPLDLPALSTRAVQLLPETRRNGYAGTPALHVAIVGGPLQRILRPSELEDPQLANKLHQQALFGTPRLFDATKGMESNLEDDALVLEQERGARIRIDEQAGLLLRLPLEKDRQRGHGLQSIIEETVLERLNAALAFSSWSLQTIDASQRLTHVAVAASIEGGGYMAWRTQAEQDASPNSGGMGLGDRNNVQTQGTWPRAALRLESHRLSEDLMVRLRRAWHR